MEVLCPVSARRFPDFQYQEQVPYLLHCVRSLACAVSVGPSRAFHSAVRGAF